MSVPIPSDLELLDQGALLGRVRAGEEPLRTLMRRINWSYATHAPPLVDVCPYAASKGSMTFDLPVAPSADGLDYTFTIVCEVTAATTLTWSLSYLTAYGGTALLITNGTLSTTTGSVRSETLTTAATVPATARFVRLALSMGSGNIKTHQVLAYPTKMTSITAGSKTSGVTVYEDTDLEGGWGAIHTEYLNRAWASARALCADRVQQIAGFQAESGGLRFSKALVGTGGLQQFVIVGPVGFDGPGAREVTVRCVANDTGAAFVRMGQIDGEVAKLSANGSEQTATITLRGETPVIFALVEPDNGCDVTLLSFEYAADIGSADALINEPAPPARVEYLSAINSLQVEGLLTTYAATLRSFDWPGLSSGEWYALQVIPPGTRAFRVMTVQSSNGGGSAQTDPTVWGEVDGFTTSAAVSFPSNQSGSQAYPPSIDTVVAIGGEGYDATPSGESDRMLTATEDREPVKMAVRAKECIGMTLIPRPVANIRDV